MFSCNLRIVNLRGAEVLFFSRKPIKIEKKSRIGKSAENKLCKPFWILFLFIILVLIYYKFSDQNTNCLVINSRLASFGDETLSFSLKYYWMNDSSHTVESTSSNSRVRVESESLRKSDSSRLESESWLGLAQPWLPVQNRKNQYVFMKHFTML